MKKISAIACALILASPVLVPGISFAKEKTATMAATPSEDSKALAAKQLDAKLGELKEALEGMHTAIGKGDRASFILYRTQAKTALTEIDKIGTLQLGSE